MVRCYTSIPQGGEETGEGCLGQENNTDLQIEVRVRDLVRVRSLNFTPVALPESLLTPPPVPPVADQLNTRLSARD